MLKKIAVTGSNGFIGSHLVKKLTKKGYEILKIDIKNGLNILDTDSLGKLQNIDAIIHLAARTFVPDAFNNPREFYTFNYIATLNALEMARGNNAKFLFLSSYLYGQPDYLPVDENHLLKPHNPYAQSKLICEKLCEGYSRDYSLPIAIFRPFNVYGDGQGSNFLIPSLISQLDSSMVLLDDPRPKRDFIHVSDLSDLLVKAIEVEYDQFEVYNVGSGTSTSILEIIEILRRKILREIEFTFSHKYRRGEVLETVANIEKASKTFNWTPQISFEAGFSSLLISEKVINEPI